MLISELIDDGCYRNKLKLTEKQFRKNNSENSFFYWFHHWFKKYLHIKKTSWHFMLGVVFTNIVLLNWSKLYIKPLISSFKHWAFKNLISFSGVGFSNFSRKLFIIYSKEFINVSPLNLNSTDSSSVKVFGCLLDFNCAIFQLPWWLSFISRNSNPFLRRGNKMEHGNNQL